jgi:RND family efflux transporter MFP subunit
VIRKVAALAIAAACAAAAPATANEAPPSTARRVRLVEAASAAASPWAAASLAPARRATLSTRLSATVRALRAEEGARVRRGELLVQLSDDDVRAQVAAAETGLANATSNLRRIRELAAQRAATPSELEQAQAQQAQAQAQAAAARASLEYTRIRAPFDGVVQARKVNVGDLVGPGQPLLDVEGGELEVQGSLSEGEARGLRIGQAIRFESGDAHGVAEVTALTTGGDPLSHRRFLRAKVVAGGEGARSGSFARIELPGGARAERTAWVPKSAVVERGDLTGVFVAEGGKAELRWVALGEPIGDRYPVRAGLRSDEAVIDQPGALRDGEPVEVARAE